MLSKIDQLVNNPLPKDFNQLKDDLQKPHFNVEIANSNELRDEELKDLNVLAHYRATNVAKPWEELLASLMKDPLQKLIIS